MPATTRSAYRLVRATPAAVDPPRLDEHQQAVVDHPGGPLLVLAGPGTGKTTTLVEAIVRRVERGLDPDRVLALTFSRRAAAELRTRVTARLGRTTTEPLARTVHSYAFGLLRRTAVLRGEPSPRLLAGAEQDRMVRDLLAGDLETDPSRWPASLRPALSTRGFAQELRDLLLRALERGVTPEHLDALGRGHGREDWQAAARFMTQYAGATALAETTDPSAVPSYDPAELIRAAVDLLASDDALLAAERAARAAVFVDEYQDTDPAQEELLALLAGDGRDLVVVGDPDQSIYAFRGSDVDAIRHFPDRFPARTGEPAPVSALRVCRRSGPGLVAATRRVAERMRGPVAHRSLQVPGIEAPSTPDRAEAHLFVTASQQAAYAAHRLRVAHLRDGVPWSRMAVLVRSTERLLPVLHRALGSAGVPVAVNGDEIPLVDQPAVRATLRLLGAALDPASLDEQTALELVGSAYGGADGLGIRRLRQALRAAETRAGGSRSSAELLVEVIERPIELSGVPERIAAPATRVAELIGRARVTADAGGSAEDVLWAVWSSSGLAAQWQEASLAGGRTGAQADRDLDAMVALFEMAARFVDRLPGSKSSVFLTHVAGQQIPSDSLAPRAPVGETVSILTAHAAKGLEWDVVVVAGVQEGVWPNLRTRGSLLGSEVLVDVLADRDSSIVSASAAQLDEERRLFYVAATRARSLLVVTAVDGDEEQPSRFLDEIDPPPHDEEGRPIARARSTVPRTLSLPALVAELRRTLADPAGEQSSAAVRDAAATVLADLADSGVPGADPADWYGLASLSDGGALVAPGEPVAVSPSRVESYLDCPLRWLLTSVGADGREILGASIGTLVHDAAALVTDDESATADALMAQIDQRWAELDLGNTWISRAEHDRAERIIAKLAAWFAADPRELVAAEEAFEVAIGRALLRGRVDRLERDGEDRLHVVDFKTGKSKPRDADVAEHAQLAVYQLAVSYGAFGDAEPGGARLVQLGTSTKTLAEQEQAPPAQSADPELGARLLASAADGMAGAEFSAQLNDGCGYCPVQTCCPAQTRGRQVTE